MNKQPKVFAVLDTFLLCDKLSYEPLGHYTEIRPLFTSYAKEARKYTDDLFLMGPFYHRIFPYEKMILLDADLKFKIDIDELYEHFSEFQKAQVMGVGIDLAPHYRIAFREYREQNPGTVIGEPGRFQVSEKKHEHLN